MTVPSYAAFLSYARADQAPAQCLHRALESYRLPSAIREGNKHPLFPVFRDVEEAASGPLAQRLKDALAASRNLVVVCSPDAAGSEWVEAEIDYFKKLGKQDRIFAYVVRGARELPIGDLFPPTLRASCEGTMPRIPVADERSDGDGPRLAFSKLIAGLLSVDLRLLLDAEARRRRWRRFTIASACLALAISVGVWSALWIEDHNYKARLIGEGAIATARKNSDCFWDDEPCKLAIKMALAAYEASWLDSAAGANALRIVLPTLSTSRQEFLRWHSGRITSLHPDKAATGFVLADSRFGRFHLDSRFNLATRISTPPGKIQAFLAATESKETPNRPIGEVLCMSADGQLFLTREWVGPLPSDGPLPYAEFVLRVRDGRTGEIVHDFGRAGEVTQHSSFSSDKRYILTAAGEGTQFSSVKVWDRQREAVVCTIQAQVQRDDPPNSHFRVVAFGPESTTLWVASSAIGLQAVELPTCSAMRQYEATDLRKPAGDLSKWTDEDYRNNVSLTISAAAALEDQSLVAAAFIDRKVRVWRGADGAQVQAFSPGVGHLRSLRFSSDGKRLVAGGNDGIAVWSFSDETIVDRIASPAIIAVDARLTEDGTAVAGLLGDGSARLWSLGNGQQLGAYGTSDWPVMQMVFSGDGGRWAAHRLLEGVVVGNSGNGDELFRIGASSTVGMALDHIGSVLGVVDDKGRLSLRQVSDGEDLARRFECIHDRTIGRIGFLKGKLFFSDRNGGLQELNLENGECRRLLGESTGVAGLAVDFEKQQVMILTMEGSVVVFDGATSRPRTVSERLFSKEEIGRITATAVLGDRSMFAMGREVRTLSFLSPGKPQTVVVDPGWLVTGLDPGGCRLLLSPQDAGRYIFRVVDCKGGRDVLANAWYGGQSVGGSIVAAFSPSGRSMLVARGPLMSYWHFEHGDAELYRIGCSLMSLEDAVVSDIEVRRWPMLAYGPRKVCGKGQR